MKLISRLRDLLAILLVGLMAGCADTSGGAGILSSLEQPSELPSFPWPPPTASASYVLPPKALSEFKTVGEVADSIVFALEKTGYVERSFFSTEQDGVVLVTRLERIEEDGAPTKASQRWPAGFENYRRFQTLGDFFRGLFFVEPGRYRVIVFVLQEKPFVQASRIVDGREGQSWLSTGANRLPRIVAERQLDGATCTVLIYEFQSDGSAVRVVQSRTTGKGHLERTGLLASLAIIN